MLRGYVKKHKPALWTTMRPGSLIQTKPEVQKNGAVVVLKRIRPFSKRTAAINRNFAKLMKTWWSQPENKFCCAPGCADAATDPHHTRGRGPQLTCDLRFIVPLCRACHNRVQAEPTWARSVEVMRNGRFIPLLAAKGDWKRAEKKLKITVDEKLIVS